MHHDSALAAHVPFPGSEPDLSWHYDPKLPQAAGDQHPTWAPVPDPGRRAGHRSDGAEPFARVIEGVRGSLATVRSRPRVTPATSTSSLADLGDSSGLTSPAVTAPVAPARA